MRSLLEQLEVQRNAFVRENRDSPCVELIRTKGERLLGKLTDVGSDYVEMSGFYTGSPVIKIARSQIAEVQFIDRK